jgi:hypothetical protein
MLITIWRGCLHSKHWTRQQAIDYGIQASEVDRYSCGPDRRVLKQVSDEDIAATRRP